jgi:hypothetical protein
MELMQNNAKYGELSRILKNITKEIEGAVQEDYRDLFEKLLDIHSELSRIELNYLYVRGFRDCVSLYKRFDSSSAENQEFEKYFMQ